MTTREKLSVPEIHCGHCKSSIEGAVGQLDGVEFVEVDIDSTSVDVAYADPASRQSIVEAIEAVGYEVPSA